jgi:hypothetical protein
VAREAKTPRKDNIGGIGIMAKTKRKRDYSRKKYTNHNRIKVLG